MKPPSMQLVSTDPCLLCVAPGEVIPSVIFVVAFKMTISKMHKTHHHSVILNMITEQITSVLCDYYLGIQAYLQ